MFLGSRKLYSILRDMNDPNLCYEEMEMRLCGKVHPQSLSKPTTEILHEDCEGGVTSTDIDLAVEENPAYQSVHVKL